MNNLFRASPVISANHMLGFFFIIMAYPQRRRVVVFSGGSAANSLVDVFNEVIEKNHCALDYVIPISDNGGSSSELIRVFGGPGIGDVRSMTSSLMICFSTSPSTQNEVPLE